MPSSSVYPEGVRRLVKNPKEDFLKAANVLIRIARNIIDYPSEEKYKSVKISSKVFMAKLIPADGAVQCLSEMGFVQLDEKYVYMAQDPGAALLKNMKIALEKAINSPQNIDVGSVQEQVQKLLVQQKASAPCNTEYRHNRSTAVSEHQMQQRFESYCQSFLRYGDEILQTKARSLVPLDDLTKKAQDRLDEKPEFSTAQGKIPLSLSDCLVIELLHWFKHNFFKWIDSPECEKCPGAKRTSKGMGSATHEERAWDAGRVEIYTCNNCGCILRYPRYNNPEKLLETRGGRCGEWANCFTLFCVAMGYETRHVVDWTDHVWTEVYSDTAKRWIHLDPCENAFDKPLMYEKGWGKKLSLIIGVSRYEIADVTWRYVESITDADVKSRRAEMFRENWLSEILKKMSVRRQAGISKQKRNEINDRVLRETVELSSPKVESSVVYVGRTTGSLEWRKARGELGENVRLEAVLQKLTNSEEGTIHLKYFSAEDKYVTNQGTDELEGWKTLVHSFSSVQRKVEDDWRMAYLARTPSSASGNVCWKFDLSGSERNTVVKSVAVKVQSTTFQSGKISWLLSSDEFTQKIESGQTYQFGAEVEGSKVLSLRAFLTGGDGDNAWQQTQLFRESLDERSSEPQLDITIEYYTKH